MMIAAHQINYSNLGHIIFLACVGIFALWLLITIVKKFL